MAWQEILSNLKKYIFPMHIYFPEQWNQSVCEQWYSNRCNPGNKRCIVSAGWVSHGLTAAPGDPPGTARTPPTFAGERRPTLTELMPTVHTEISAAAATRRDATRSSRRHGRVHAPGIFGPAARAWVRPQLRVKPPLRSPEVDKTHLDLQ